jgi:hypothetical protein
MTALSTTLKRRVEGLLAKPLTILLFPRGTIGFQEYRSRKVYTLPVLTCYRLAIEAERRAVQAAKKLARKSKQEVK